MGAGGCGEERSMKRLLALITSALLFALAAVPASASASPSNLSQGLSYLALGDSVPFGFNPLVDASNINNFTGYPEIVAQRLHLRDVNATCPGEATGGFLSLTGTDNVCRPYRSAFPLHVSYATSQIDFAMAYLRTHPHTRLVTLTLGANDVFRFQKDCAVAPTFGTCPLGLGGVFATMLANLNTILADIRSSGYTGLIVGVTYYALNYGDPASVAGSQFLNAAMIAAAAGHGALIASGFDAWAPVAATAGGDSCAAGLLIRLPDGTCDVHPTPLGRDLLASAVAATVAATCPAGIAVICVRVRN
jgi:lysophospholipase L1-like esterase